MIALLLATVVGAVLAVCLWFGLAVIAGMVVGTVQVLRWKLRRARGLDAGPTPWERARVPLANLTPVPFEVRAAVWARDGGRCVYCGATEDLTVDHVIPRAHGGSNDPSNLVLACRSCNASKGARDAPGRGTAHVAMMLGQGERAARRATNGNGRH